MTMGYDSYSVMHRSGASADALHSACKGHPPLSRRKLGCQRSGDRANAVAIERPVFTEVLDES